MFTSKQCIRAASILWTLVLCAGCGTDMGSGDTTGNASAPKSSPPEQLRASHILVMHTESSQAPENITRSTEEARALAEEIARKIKQEGADFADLAKEYSDCPSAARGGDLGNFSPRQMVPAFTEAVEGLEVGQVSDPVETQFGYHVIRRDEIKKLARAGARHVLVQYEGSMRAPASVTRTKQEALRRIEECFERAKQGEDFAALARQYSDCPTAEKGGDLGEFPEGKMTPEFDSAVFELQPGEMSDVVETPFGYHIILRYQ